MQIREIGQYVANICSDFSSGCARAHAERFPLRRGCTSFSTGIRASFNIVPYLHGITCNICRREEASSRAFCNNRTRFTIARRVDGTGLCREADTFHSTAWLETSRGILSRLLRNNKRGLPGKPAPSGFLRSAVVPTRC